MPSLGLSERFKCQGDALAAANAQREHAPAQAVPAHRMKQPRRQYRAGRADLMAMRDGTPLDIDDVLRQPEFLGDGQWDNGEGLVDLNAVEVAERPACTLQRLPHGG